ncbi:hypothetical protein BRC86_03540 [Halobacteriales archaeon QS_3_64_16]|nr:MAG: hypothetical protein BRC86_03540 [Halobacteriales archaeon QS_3_64_16]
MSIDGDDSEDGEEYGTDDDAFGTEDDLGTGEDFGIDDSGSDGGGDGDRIGGGIPTDVSPRERAALERTRTVARLLDSAIPVPGTNYRVGLDSIVGLLPVSGDIVTGVIGLYIIAEAGLVGAPRNVLGRMVFNILVDVLIGSVPAIGDLFDAAWKANLKNVELFEEYLESDGIESI